MITKSIQKYSMETLKNRFLQHCVNNFDLKLKKKTDDKNTMVIMITKSIQKYSTTITVSVFFWNMKIMLSTFFYFAQKSHTKKLVSFYHNISYF